MKDFSKELGNFLKKYIATHSISFVREDPHSFVSRLSGILSPFFSPSNEDILLEGLKGKSLHCLWNFVIDDTIEYTDKGKESIIDSVRALTESRTERDFNAGTDAGQIMHDLVQRIHELPPGPNKEVAEEFALLDIIRVIDGFDHERIIHENDIPSSFLEYIEFGTATIDIRIFLDIDMAICPFELNASIIGTLREAYRWFGLAEKLSSDIATFEREYFVEASQNAVVIYGQEKGLLPKDILKADLEHKERLFKSVIPSLMDDIEDKGREYLSKSLESLDRISEIDTSQIAQVFKTTFEKYPAQRIFSPPSSAKD